MLATRFGSLSMAWFRSRTKTTWKSLLTNRTGVANKYPNSLTHFSNMVRTGTRYAASTSVFLSERHLWSAFLPLQVSQVVGKPAHQCEALYKQHALYLNLASQLIQKEAFMGMVRSSQEHEMQVSTPMSSANLTLALQQAHLLQHAMQG